MTPHALLRRLLPPGLLVRSLVLLLGLAAASPAIGPPRPLADHPGNVFLAGEEVAVELPPADPDAWRAVDYEGRTVAEGHGSGRIALGRLPVGYYEVRRGDEPRPLSAGVLAPLAKPSPPCSGMGLDVAMAWFYKEDRMAAAANLCTLAGVNWVRDRLSWGEVEPQRGKFQNATRYDASARIQAAAGLRVLQVNHSSPAWAGADHKRFPADLRDAYRFYREMAARWRGQVRAFEPWNEADIPQFGGHTGAEIASLQKAAYLGLREGNPQVIVCQNVFAIDRAATLDDFQANEAWPYFDAMNLHHYAPLDRYPAIYAHFRAVSAGRPLWVTECAIPVKWSGDERLQEPSAADLRAQAQRVAKVYCGSLHEGSRATFYFLLPHYTEHQTQFGILRPDLTPRPAYVALAAVGRLLGRASPRGRLKPPANQPSLRGYAFGVWPDGEPHDVLVAWSESGESPLTLPQRPGSVYDHLGRTQEPAETLQLTSAPQYAVFPPDSLKQLDLEPPPHSAPRREGEASPVVLQAVWPKERVDVNQSAYRVSAGKPDQVRVFAYNFGSAPVEGRLESAASEVGKCVPQRVSIAAGERVELALTVDLRESNSKGPQPVTLRGDFGPAGKPVLSLRLIPSKD